MCAVSTCFTASRLNFWGGDDERDTKRWHRLTSYYAGKNKLQTIRPLPHGRLSRFYFFKAVPLLAFASSRTTPCWAVLQGTCQLAVPFSNMAVTLTPTLALRLPEPKAHRSFGKGCFRQGVLLSPVCVGWSQNGACGANLDREADSDTHISCILASYPIHNFVMLLIIAALSCARQHYCSLNHNPNLRHSENSSDGYLREAWGGKHPIVTTRVLVLRCSSAPLSLQRTESSLFEDGRLRERNRLVSLSGLAGYARNVPHGWVSARDETRRDVRCDGRFGIQSAVIFIPAINPPFLLLLIGGKAITV